jgi:hypothetical protein
MKCKGHQSSPNGITFAGGRSDRCQRGITGIVVDDLVAQIPLTHGSPNPYNIDSPPKETGCHGKPVKT